MIKACRVISMSLRGTHKVDMIKGKPRLEESAKGSPSAASCLCIDVDDDDIRGLLRRCSTQGGLVASVYW